MNSIWVVVVVCGVLGSSAIAFAAENQAAGADFFDDVNLEDAPKKHQGHLIEGDSWYVKGFVKANGSYSVYDRQAADGSVEDAGWSQVRLVGDVLLDGQLDDRGNYRINGNISRDHYGEMDNGFEWREVYVNWELLDNLWIKTGRQIIAWGESDFSQLLDEANPRDKREIGVVDAEDVRIPVWSTKLSLVGKRWGADLAVIHEFRDNRTGGEGNDFDPYIRLRNQLTILDGPDPDVDAADPEVMARAFFSFPQGDLSFIAGSVYDDSAALRAVAPGVLETFHEKTRLAGVAGNWVTGDWVLKLEWAHKNNVAVPVAAMQPFTGKPLDQLMLGTDYSVNADVDLTVEWLAERIGDYDDTVLLHENQFSIISSLRYSLWHETGKLSLFWGHFIQAGSDTLRADFTYDYTDQIKLGCGAVGYWAQDQSAYLYPYRKDDRVYLNIQYSF